MTIQSHILKILLQEDLNFLLTNRIPRRLATRFMGWFSQIEQPLVRDLSIGVFRFFSGLDLSEAKKTQFRSLRDCFVRELKDGARPVDGDPAILASPCDAISAPDHTPIALFQVKGFPYTLQDAGRSNWCAHRGAATSRCGWRKHDHPSTHDAASGSHLIRGYVERQRSRSSASKLFCRTRLASKQARGATPTLVPVAAYSVASIRLPPRVVRSRAPWANVIPAMPPFRKGEKWAGFSTARRSSSSPRRLQAVRERRRGCAAGSRCCLPYLGILFIFIYLYHHLHASSVGDL